MVEGTPFRNSPDFAVSVMPDRSSPPRGDRFQGLFDVGHYLSQLGPPLAPGAVTAQQMQAHFCAVGDRIGLDPSPYFDTRWYKAQHPDWAQTARTAVEDFLARIDSAAPRGPHPMIDPDFYLKAYPDLAGLGPQAALHFIRHGDAEARSPSAAFDASFYRQTYLPLGTGHPFRHYICEGRARGHLPRPQLRSAEASARAMRAALTKRAPARPFLLVAHDAQSAGVPLLTLDLAQALQARGWQPVFLLNRAGPLLPRLQRVGPVFLAAEGWQPGGLAHSLPIGTPALINTGVAARFAPALTGAGLRVLVLIHEMADYLRAQGLIPDLGAAQQAGAGLMVSMPRMVPTLADLPDPVEQILPGVLLPATPLAAFRARRRKAGRRRAPWFINAGHADHRKGFDLFLEAATALQRKMPKARFVWLGALDPWAQALADQARAAGLRLKLPGFVTDSLAWYRAADAYLLTSRQDPGPTTVIHAAAMGTPFVGYAADIGLIGLTEGMGHFVPPGDLAGFVATARHLATAGSPAKRRHLRRLVRRATDFETYVEALLTRLNRAPDGAA